MWKWKGAVCWPKRPICWVKYWECCQIAEPLSQPSGEYVLAACHWSFHLKLEAVLHSAMERPKAVPFKAGSKPNRCPRTWKLLKKMIVRKKEKEAVPPEPPRLTPQQIQENLFRKLPLVVLQRKFRWLRENSKLLSTWDLERNLEKAIRRKKGLPSSSSDGWERNRYYQEFPELGHYQVMAVWEFSKSIMSWKYRLWRQAVSLWWSSLLVLRFLGFWLKGFWFLAFGSRVRHGNAMAFQSEPWLGTTGSARPKILKPFFSYLPDCLAWRYIFGVGGKNCRTLGIVGLCWWHGNMFLGFLVLGFWLLVCCLFTWAPTPQIKIKKVHGELLCPHPDPKMLKIQGPSCKNQSPTYHEQSLKPNDIPMMLMAL